MVKIRLLEGGDIKQTAKVFADAYNKSEGKEDWNIEDAVKCVEYLKKKQPDLFFVAINNHKVVGGMFSEIKPYIDGNWLVDSELFVDPDLYNKGIGKKLFEKLLTNAIKKHKIVRMQGIVDTKKDFPLTWYGKIGLKRTGWVDVAGNPKEILDKLINNY